MGWERRKNNWYYTRSRRENGRVVRMYFGCGPEAEKAAADDLQRREALKQERLKWDQKRAKRANLEALIDQYDAIVDLLFRAEMTCRGYHYHRGEWRKRRGFERRMAEQEAARRQREQQASAAELPTDENSPPPRRPVPTGRPRTLGPGLIRHMFRGPEMARLGRRIAAERCPGLGCIAQRQRGLSVNAAYFGPTEVAVRRKPPGISPLVESPNTGRLAPFRYKVRGIGLSAADRACQGAAARPPPERHAC